MLNNVALDVFIGLVFIFLLYSLLASAINEFIAMLFAYRHRMLEKAIEQMLDGKNYSYYWWNKLANIFFWWYHKILVKEKEVPGLKEGIINKVDKKDFFKTCNINPQITEDSSSKILRSKLNKKAALFAANITNHPLYRRKSEDSLLYKKPAYLTASAFSDILMDVLGNRRNNNNTAPILLNDIKTFVNNELENNPDLKSILNLYIQQANGDIQKFKLLIENWFDDTMNRVSGWYKRQATKILFAIGFVLAMSLNVSTIDIVHRLSVDKDLREAMAQSATNYVKTKNAQISSFTDKDSLDTAVNKQITQIHTLYDSTIAPVNSLMGLGWDYNTADSTIHKKVWYVLKETATKPRSLFGFIITALAITMGAPFWFDLLNRFVNIRGGGNKPSEDSANRSATVSITEKINQKPAINSFG
jgi:hypothetical protein